MVIDPMNEASMQMRQLEAAAKHIEGVLKTDATVLKLNTGPVSMIVKRLDGTYRHMNFLGKEEFTFASAYAGKKGKVILVFKPAYVTSDFKFLELNVEEAKTKMISTATRFETWYDFVTRACIVPAGRIIVDIDEMNSIEKQKQEAVKLADPVWGSW